MARVRDVVEYRREENVVVVAKGRTLQQQGFVVRNAETGCLRNGHRRAVVVECDKGGLVSDQGDFDRRTDRVAVAIGDGGGELQVERAVTDRLQERLLVEHGRLVRTVIDGKELINRDGRGRRIAAVQGDAESDKLVVGLRIAVADETSLDGVVVDENQLDRPLRRGHACKVGANQCGRRQLGGDGVA